ncbi:uncharacterized protein AMSG_11724 [Thecamonas trahens ATCC 50062]|uniref:Fe2OG dioxygenase domain-containing protein n=1 Tax=Thecamonas trahens ATCC 50062 TaxID=461836 RepID=A0A0L0D5I0_THETB|nr:hypothetical protein AMSG_11724 [Thecamonas trahens ATCC 50062]KNC47622.1 hypothetical protein AMSG_11724 [Thecamonas trahens ATCC 50062]|eukprot:XP_013759568.1 hypothetical protein AMSG_11724 [Thecamonas trahens ATCC 50062]
MSAEASTSTSRKRVRDEDGDGFTRDDGGRTGKAARGLDGEAVPGVPGLTVVTDAVSPEDELALLAQVDNGEWMTSLKRRVQHYGYRYDYRSRKVAPESYLGELPEWSKQVMARLGAAGDGEFDQLIVNEYEPGQGISAHIDCKPCFAGVIVSVSLGSGAVMRFAKDDVVCDVWLPARSAVVLTGPARWEWSHSIAGRKSDKVGGVRIKRTRRVSLTFRTVRLAGSEPATGE